MTSYALRSTLFVDTNPLQNVLESQTEEPEEDSDGYLVLTFNNGSNSNANTSQNNEQNARTTSVPTTRLTSRFTTSFCNETQQINSDSVQPVQSQSIAHSPSSTSTMLSCSSSVMQKSNSPELCLPPSRPSSTLIIESHVNANQTSKPTSIPTGTKLTEPMKRDLQKNGKIHRVVQIKNGQCYIQPVAVQQKQLNNSSGLPSHNHDNDSVISGGSTASSSMFMEKYVNKYATCKSLTNGGSRMLKCGECGKYYRNQYSLKHHICLKRKDVWKKGDVPSQLVNGQLVYYCPTCFKPFKWLGNLTRHFYVHTGQRFFKCNVCNKEFFSAYQVRRHMNSHTGLRFKCEFCAKPFTCKYACAWHTRQHGNECI